MQIPASPYANWATQCDHQQPTRSHVMPVSSSRVLLKVGSANDVVEPNLLSSDEFLSRNVSKFDYVLEFRRLGAARARTLDMAYIGGIQTKRARPAVRVAGGL